MTLYDFVLYTGIWLIGCCGPIGLFHLVTWLLRRRT